MNDDQPAKMERSARFYRPVALRLTLIEGMLAERIERE
jgi:hypothetical protein